MDIVILLVFISLVLVAAGLSFFFDRLREGDFDHADRLALTPLADDEVEASEPPNGSAPEKPALAAEAPEGGRPHVKP